MEISKNILYILVEGKEWSFIERAIQELIYANILPQINYDVIEVGGSGNFNAIAKILYTDRSLHKHIPVIAIKDRDFTEQQKINQENDKNDSNLIETKAAKIVYWQRNEWENYLLEETATIANILNQLPTQVQGRKPYKTNTINTLTKEQLDQWLIEYLQSSICNELVECLRFRFRQNYERLKLDKPQNEIFSLEEIEIWFKEQIQIKCGESQTKIQALETILNNKLQEITWQSWFHDPMVLDINQAKRLFQGRQALKHLFDQAKKYLSIQHLNYDIFIGKMLLPEIEKNINSAILHDIGLMLNVYFQQAANLTEIE
ncbi:hypothetical protein MEN41_04930 [Dolichospermum sp. ST_con]|nr:hypothetical protein [Dolichospermum sp. ST_con]MDD1417945.1 hypothetical protein [Dolichospermum sp. ST_sed1]MDD1423717.1 hypothetical protein [Dolichospermum sp. ST_sed9]MDD1431039.1 hypothetical protein [Dolichospermum sp. ST_sed6]MDD1435294.1 hypothetical protein [Dolichospermum sp. ST_sed10]MDD1439207.1 hypothetical protein [Dolichospermum sp. ST_sed3]MDD1445472.1 hypothetical protein [Dolichospermum sp. ST_sed8]MDD1453941.1 hypothetical protein [Dolichospermum sp. ST_sed7]MDD145983